MFYVPALLKALGTKQPDAALLESGGALRGGAPGDLGDEIITAGPLGAGVLDFGG